MLLHSMDVLHLLIHPSAGKQCVVFTFWLLQTLIRTLMYKLLYGCMCSVLLSRYLGLELMGHMVTLSLHF